MNWAIAANVIWLSSYDLGKLMIKLTESEAISFTASGPKNAMNKVIIKCKIRFIIKLQNITALTTITKNDILINNQPEIIINSNIRAIRQ